MPYDVLKPISSTVHPQQYLQQLSLLLAYLMPVFVLAIRWKSSFGDHSRIGMALASFMFHLLHGLFLAGCVWLVFDPPFSPRHNGFGLPFYYLIALSAGYYSGYFLLIFGKKIARQRGRQPSRCNGWIRYVVAGVWLLGVVAVAGLVYRNAPQIRDTNGDTFRRYTSLIEEKLPPEGRLFVERRPAATVSGAVGARAGRAGAGFCAARHAIAGGARLSPLLHRKFPQRWPELVSATQTNALNPVGLIQVLAMLARTNDLYYLHPSFRLLLRAVLPGAARTGLQNENAAGGHAAAAVAG
jgi:hypothetical protein